MSREHPYINRLKQQFVDGRCSRREFLRTSTLLGVSAAAAYGFVGKVTGETFTTPAKGAGISIVALSLSSVTSDWSTSTRSPGATST